MELLLRNEVARYSRFNKTPADFAPRVLQTRIRPTARNKMKSVQRSGESYSGNLIQTTSFVVEEARALPAEFKNVKNLLLTQTFLSKFEKSIKPTADYGVDAQSKFVYLGIDAGEIINFLREYETGSSNTRFRPQDISNYIEELNEQNELTNWSVGVVGRQMDESLGNFSFGEGHQTGRITRALDKDSDRSIGQLINPIKMDSTGRAVGDEVLDFSFDELVAMQKLQIEHPEISLAQASRQIRPINRGLLLIYPISPFSIGRPRQDQSQTGKNNSSTLGSALFRDSNFDRTIIGLSLVFPYSEQQTRREYYQGTAGRAETLWHG
jgi:hypothetical protein